ncbi:phosphotransferase [Limobrevibacterium gyesilva]|nr:phosphotransferase [Limobrevibacterium gyesilva]
MTSFAPVAHDIFSVMTVPAEQVAPATAEAVALAGWGLRASATLLTGERDRNFRLVAADGAEYVLKFANPAEDPAVTDLQIQALLHIAASDPGFPVPRIVKRPDGAAEALLPRDDGSVQRVRLLSWLPGVPLRQARRSAAQRAACGRALARLGLALRGFTHPAGRHALIWDVTHVPRLREVMDTLDHAAAQDAVASVLDDFDARARPVLPTLRHQVLHNDMNTGNTLVDAADPDRLVGMIDFGDMVETALAIDVAVGATSQIGADMGAAEAMAVFVAGFHAVRPLTPDELAVLPVLIAARLCMSLVLPAWHRRVHPGNPHYPPMTATEITRRLGLIAAARSADTAHALRRACGLS